MDDLISRQALLEKKIRIPIARIVTEDNKTIYRDVVFVKDIEALPSAQPETAKRIVGKSRDGMTLWYQCDMCNEPVNAQDNFCIGCGRRLVNE